MYVLEVAGQFATTINSPLRIDRRASYKEVSQKEVSFSLLKPAKWPSKEQKRRIFQRDLNQNEVK